jgi:hypothetical protein
MTSIKAAPHAGINPGGDCGPSCIAGVTGLTVKQVYDQYFNGRYDGTCYQDMLAACWKLYHEDKITWIDNKLPFENSIKDPEYAVFGNPSWSNFNNWLDNAIQHINAGCIGLAQVHLHGNAMGDRKHQFSHNHWLLIVGATTNENQDWEEDNRKVYLSCPTHGEFSKHPLEFLMNYGGYNTIWIKPN